tara:strand:+ start:884 stop:1186 length:303 start_codon:yes stop_codon:yes gene_type:complete
MPSPNQKINIKFTLEEVDIMDIQEASKFLLRCMYKLSEDNDFFLYNALLKFMKTHYKNSKYYKGKGIRSVDNINHYWRYSKSETHSARIPNFHKLFHFKA